MPDSTVSTLLQRQVRLTPHPVSAHVPNSGGNGIVCLNIAAWQSVMTNTTAPLHLGYTSGSPQRSCSVTFGTSEPFQSRDFGEVARQILPFPVSAACRTWSRPQNLTPRSQSAANASTSTLLHSKLSGQSRHHLETPARGNRSPIGRLRRDIRVPAPLSARRHGPSTTTAIATSRVPVHSLSLLFSKLCDGKIVTNINVVDVIATINCPFSDCFQQCDYDYLLRTDAKGRAHGPPHLGAGVGSAAFDAPGRRLGRPCSVPDAPKGRCTSAA